MKPKNITGLAFMLLVLAGSVFGQNTGAAASAPKIVIKPEFSLGEVKRGTPAVHSYIFKNEGTADLEIKRVAPTCGCTASEFTKTVPPGQEGKITLSVATENYTGPVSKTAEVYTNDPQKDQFTLVINFIVPSDMTPKGRVVGPFIVGPTNQWSSRVPHGLTASGLIAITNNTEQPVKITKLNPGGEAFKVNLQTLEEGKRYSINFNSVESLPVGSHKQTVRLATDSKETPELTVELEAVVFPAVTVNPMNLVFENVPVSDPESDVTYLSKFVWIRLGRGNGLEMKSMTSNLPFIKVKVESTDGDGRSVVLRVGFSEKPPKGTHTGKLRIETNNSDVKVIELPLTVTAN